MSEWYIDVIVNVIVAALGVLVGKFVCRSHCTSDVDIDVIDVEEKGPQL